jgi:diacylglycerol kinase (ATP)
MSLLLDRSVAQGYVAGRPGDVPAGRGPWRLGMMSNPLSGGNIHGRLNAVHGLLQDYPDVPHREVRTVEEVQATLDEFARRDLNLVVVNSGDGTIQAALTALLTYRSFRTLPLLALLSGGTTNMTHQDLGLRGPRLGALRRLMNWAYHGEGEALIRQRTILKVQNPCCPNPLYGFFFGTACIFKGIQFFHSKIHRMGLSGNPAHLMILARFLWGLARRDDALVAPMRAGICVDRSDMGSKEYLLLLVTTLERLILGLRPFWNRDKGPLQLTAVSARPLSLFRALPALIQGRCNSYAVAENGYLSCGASEIQLDIDGGFAIDGELFAADLRSGPVVVQDGGVADFLLL